jgi:hypothetical protein
LVKLNMGLVKLNRRKLNSIGETLKLIRRGSCEGLFKLGLWVW